MSPSVFVDTNILVYARDASEPAKQAAAMAWLTQLWRDHAGRTSLQVLSEYYVTVTRKLKPGLSEPEAWDDVSALLEWQPHPLDAELLRNGRDVATRHRLSWWDGLVVAAAQIQGCSILLSEDLQAGARFDDVMVCNPFESTLREASAAYTVLPAAASRHRPVGRPRAVR